MMRGEQRAAMELIAQARDVYHDDDEAQEVLDEYDRRLREPLRLAVAGMVKAGKSTLLNALIGERIAPTDAGECTRTVTWYRYGPTARVTAHLVDGREERLAVRRSEGSLVFDLGPLTADEVARIDVEWPSESLRSMVLIDTPGIASLSEDISARSTRFLVPERTASGADAILYLLRHIHASDVSFLEAFRDTAAGGTQTVNAVALLSRADEIGSGRIDSLLSAAQIADRYRRDGELRTLALQCIPVAGLLAEGARTLRESEFAAFRHLADLDRAVRDRMLVSVDRFVRPSAETTLPPAERRALLDRFGIFGVRLATALVRGGAATSSELSDRMVQQSGLVEVQRFVADQFRSRSAALKTRGLLTGLEALLDDRPRPGADDLRGELDRILASSHDLRELALLAALREGTTPLDADAAEEADRLIGGSGTSAPARLGLPSSAGGDEIRARVADAIARWRDAAESPLADHATADICRLVIRSIEGAASELGVSDGGDRGVADVVLARGPREGGRQDAHEKP